VLQEEKETRQISGVGFVLAVYATSRIFYLIAVLREVALHSIDIRLRYVDAAASALHDAAGRHHRAWHGHQFVFDDIADQQLLRGEVIFVVSVVPDMGIAILLIRLVFRARPLADSFVGRITVPLAVGIGQIEILEARNGHSGLLSLYRLCRRRTTLRLLSGA
jgi:hypothetical protein